MHRRAVIFLLFLASCGGCEDEGQPTAQNIVRQITDPSDLIAGVEATGRVSDYVLDNGEVRFIVQEPGSSTGWGLYGGSLVDFDAKRPGGEDLFEELFVQCDLRGFAPQTAEILTGEDGSGILRLVGADAGIPFLDAILTRDPLDVTMTVDFVLPPAGRTLEIVIAVKDERKTRAREIACGFILLPGDTYELSSPDRIRGDIGGRNGYVAASAAKATTSYVLHRPDDGSVDVILDALGIIPIASDPVPFLANARIEERYLLSIGDDGGLESALDVMRLRTGESERRRNVTLEVDVPGPVSVLVVDGIGRAITSINDVVGTGQVDLAPADYQVIVSTEDYELGRAAIVVQEGDGETTVNVPLPDLGSLMFESRSIGLDGTDEGPTPARLRIIEGAGEAVSAAPKYQAYAPARYEVLLPAGAYTLVASRGPEHELFVQDVTVTAGQPTRVDVAIQRVVDTTGWVSADLHVHGTRSADSQTSRTARVLGAVAEGVDILVATDHDAVTDYAPTVDALGLQDRLRTAPGIEMSMLYGHINGYPVQANVPQDHWSPGWFVYDEAGRFERVREPDEVADTLRTAGARIVQLNHPRSSTGVFDYLGLDANGDTEKTWPEVDAFELLNGKRVDEYEVVRADLFNLIERGRWLTAVGSSDVHSDFGVGYGRTYVRTNGDLDAVWDGLAAGHAVASYGPFVTADVSAGTTTVGPGETLASQGPVRIAVQVQAPTWMDVSNLTIYENGEPWIDVVLTSTHADPVRPALRFSQTVTATPTADAYYFVEVRGGSSPPLLSRTRAAVNAVRVDVGGDGWSFR